jgi:glycosyltransferase involved in cell wall biosynthesis
MKRIKVLHFAHTFNRNDFVDLVLRYANSDRFELSAAVFSKQGNNQLPDYDGHPPIYSLGITISYPGIIKGSWKLSRLLKAKEIDVLHTHHFYESVMGMIACLLVPGCRLVVGRHYHNQFYLTASGLKLKYYLFVESIVNSRARAIISPSTMINILLEQQGVDRAKIRFIQYGFDFRAPRYQRISESERTERRRQFGWDDQYVIGNFGRHHPIKGQESLLDAFSDFYKKFPDSMLVMVGDGPLRGKLEQYAQKLGIDNRVVFLGWQDKPQLYLTAVDVVAHPTLQEAFPQIMIEVLALEIPLIITNVSGATDIIKDGQNGLLIQANDTKALLNALIKQRTDPAAARSMARQGRIDVLRDLRIEDKIGITESVYAEVAATT